MYVLSDFDSYTYDGFVNAQTSWISNPVTKINIRVLITNLHCKYILHDVIFSGEGNLRIS